MRKTILEKLLDMKMNTPEMGEGKRFDRVNEYIDRTIEKIESIIAKMPQEDTHNWDELNEVFLSLLK